MKNYKNIFLLACSLLAFSGNAQKNELTVMFYNSENFFDTLDDPNKNDNEFLPGAETKWDSKKYFKKINHIAQVIDSIGGKGFPALVGLCEVENETAVGDLVNSPGLKNANYDFKVTNSPDERSIDVALLYNKKNFQLKSFAEISATNPETPDYKTRNILFATLLFNGKETIHVFVNHWPSMRGGEAESEPRRKYAAQQLRKTIDSLVKKDASAKIIVMGDFNSSPGKDPIYNILEAKEIGAATPHILNNPFNNLAKTGKGSHYYDKEWNQLDQVMFSDGLVKSKKGLKYIDGSATDFFNDLVLYTDKKTGEKTPSRTYSGKKYFGGYSDHLAVYIKLKY